MKVILSTHYQGLVDGAAELEAVGRTVDDVLRHLDERFPGLRFRLVDEQNRLRPHVNVYVNEELTRKLTGKVKAKDTVSILGALSGG